jgi:hypothetical protein
MNPREKMENKAALDQMESPWRKRKTAHRAVLLFARFFPIC